MTTVESADDAVKIAEQLLVKYFPFRQLVKAQREAGRWTTEFNVGIFAMDIVRIIVDVESGKILEYERTVP